MYREAGKTVESLLPIRDMVPECKKTPSVRMYRLLQTLRIELRTFCVLDRTHNR
jgi:hypothetical protein